MSCRQRPDVDPAYHEFAYVSNGGSDSVSVIDTLALRNVKTIAVGKNPTGLAVNPVRNEVYVANTESNNLSIIDAERNEVVATIGVHRAPYFVSVSSGRKAGVRGQLRLVECVGHRSRQTGGDRDDSRGQRARAGEEYRLTAAWLR